MVTGDNIITASAIALECGILNDNDFGEEFEDLINKYNVEFGVKEYQDFVFDEN